MTSRSVTALSELNHIIDATFSNIEQFERFGRYTTLQSLCTALDHQVEDGLMRQRSYAFHSRKVMGLETANSFA